MSNRIIQYFLDKGITLPEKEVNVILSFLKNIHVNKKEFLFRKGDVSDKIYFVTKGAVRIYTQDKNGKDYNRFFAFDDWWIGEFHQIINHLPSVIGAQAIEKTELLYVEKSEIPTLMVKCPVFIKTILNFYLTGYAKLLEREELKKTMTIEELYQDLLDNNPLIIQKVPLYHIASYLGVKPESLSRVKKKFKQ